MGANQTFPNLADQRKNTSGPYQNESKTQLISNKDANDSKEVELKAQSNEHSQMFMDSQSQYPS
jgi:hypothetical protein